MLPSGLLKDLWLFGLLFCLGFAGACAFALINPIMLPKYFKPGVGFFFLIITCGALGGILYSTKSLLIEVPHHEKSDQNKISLGHVSPLLLDLLRSPRPDALLRPGPPEHR